MTGVVPFIRRWLWLWCTAACATYLSIHGVQRTDWYQARLYRQLADGTPRQQRQAAIMLARLGAERLLLASLQCDSSTARDYGRRGLEYLWFNAAGEAAYEMIEAADKAAQEKQYPSALEVLDRLIEKYPRFAEGWNRRASVYWELGEIEKSINDAERALALNPNHYGAWQGLGLCRLEQGSVAEACRCLRRALQIIPYDQATRDSLHRCEELLRTFLPRGKRGRSQEVI